MNIQLVKHVAVVMLSLFSLSALAEDIDLFVGTPPNESSVPNVLIILDNTANWSSSFNDERDALIALLDDTSGLAADKNFRLGLMLFTETGKGNNTVDGAYVRAALRLMTEDNRAKYKNLLNSIDIGDDKGNAGKASLAMEEAYLYFSGGKPFAGNGKAKTDYTGNTLGTAASKVVYALDGNALASKDATAYNKILSNGCAKNFIIYISNNAAQDNQNDTDQSTAALKAAGGDTTEITVSPTNSSKNVSNEWARFMREVSPLAITTYTMDVNKTFNGQGPGWTAVLKSMAEVSDGEYFDTTPDPAGLTSAQKISLALKSIFDEIQAKNSAFASVSLPVSVNTQGTFLNQVYIGMFRPDDQSNPRWQGNLKQYKLGFKSDVLQLLDADDGRAIATDDSGFIAACARSFWTPTSLDKYWAFDPSGSCGVANSDVSNSPDGNIVEKGAQAFKLREDLTRNMKTCVSATNCTSLIDFNSTNVTPQMLGLGTLELNERTKLVNWQRGLDVQDEDGKDGITLLEKRPSAHGDVVHSRPIAINYGTDSAPEVVVYYGGNDGVLRAINGNRDSAVASATAGSEIWSFVAPEFLPKIKRIYDNTVKVSYPGSPTPVDADDPIYAPKDYGVDGVISAYKEGKSAWIFATMRRGGRAVYGFNVTDPASPTLAWRAGCPNQSNDDNCSTGFGDIGQTWSAPKVMTAKGYGAGISPLLIMGGGYDTCQDADPNSACNSSSKGSQIYVMDATTGGLLQALETESSVIGDVVVVPDSDGNAKYAYAADLGGNVYRISGVDANTAIGSTSPGAWTITKIAAFGGSAADNRKFMFGPDIVDENGTYVLLLGSGDREKPLESYNEATSVKNRFYVFKDKPDDTGWLSSQKKVCGTDLICNESLFEIVSGETPDEKVDFLDKKGWYLPLASKEKVVTSSITVFNTVTFSTHMPTPASDKECANLGTATVYNLNYTNAKPLSGNLNVRGEKVTGGGLPPSPVAGMVTLDDGKTVPFCIGCSNESALQGGQPSSPTTVVRPKSRVYWKIRK